MSSYRIKTILNNKSFSVGPDIALGMGATVIPADRGPFVPVKINKGETERMRMLFGANRYEVLEAIAYNNKYPLWVSAPHSGGSSAALLLTDNGLVPCPISFNGDPDTVNFSNLWLQFKVGVSDGSTEAWEILIDKNIFPVFSSSYVPQAYLIVDDEAYPATLAWNGLTTTYDITVAGKGTGSLIADSESAIINFTFTSGEVPDSGAPIAFRITSDMNQLEDNNVYAIIGMKFPCDDFLAAAVYKTEVLNPLDTKDGNLILDIRYIKKGVYYQQSGYPVEMSLIKGTQNGRGQLIYAPEMLKTDDFIFVKPNPNAQMDWKVWDGSENFVDFKGGSRGAKCSGELLVDGWEQFKEFKKFPADIYFDTTGDAAIANEMSNLRAEIPYRRFLYPQPLGGRTEEIVAPPMVQNRGICTFWGSANILNMYEPTGNLPSTLMGEVASRYADARVFSFGGRSVAWGDENQVGGQLSQGRIIDFIHDAREDEMQRLDKLRVNPIVMNELFGPMVASRRTTDTSETDYSYSDYSMIFDYCLERIITDVLPYQLIKFNDDIHRSIVKAKAEMILKPLIQAPNNVIRDYAIKCDSENNNDEILAQEKFVLSVAVKVTTKAEWIQFNFVNSFAGGSVEEDVK